MKYRVYVRDRNLNRIAEIDDYKTITLTSRFNRPGTWLMDIDASSEVTPMLLEPGAGIIIARDNNVLLSGPVLSPYRKFDKATNVLTLGGQDDLYWLSGRLAYPAPNGQYSSVEYDVRTGPAETIMMQYVSVNAGPDALPERRVQGLILAADQARGANITGRARFDCLTDLLQSLALAGGDLGFRLIQNGINLEFQVYVPEDKTKTAIFSLGFGNLSGFEYSSNAPEANYIICGGSGEGTARVFAERGDSASISQYWRIESFRDRRDTSDTNELNQSIDEELSQKAQKSSLSINPVDTEAVSFMQDYYLGDRVTVVVDGVAIQDVVREVQISLTPDGGEVITPIIGTPGTENPAMPNIFQTVRQLKSRLNSLERR